MAKIAVLDQNTIDQIAAGEVVERPASVVKELLENAIDAKASVVTVEIRDGGTTLIRVTDNGSGVEKDEIRLAFCRHATSKIQTAEDLSSVLSLGFRGEALSSIASIAQVECISKTAGSLLGVRYRIEGGQEKGLEEVGAPEGTTFVVRNLFFNTPVRKKFLKSNQTEAAYVADLVQKIALSHPEVSIRLIQNNQNKIYTSGNHNLKDLIYTLYGRETAANILPVFYESPDGMIRVEGFAGKPTLARGNRNMEHSFINGRYIKSSILCKAIEEAYKPYMMQHMYPFVVLQITADPTFLDVNVHPTKMDVRFGNGELIYQSVCKAVTAAIAEKELIPKVQLVTEKTEKAKEVKEMSPKTEQVRPPEPFETQRQQQSELPKRLPPEREKDVWEKWDYKKAISEREMEKLEELEQRIADSQKKQKQVEPFLAKEESASYSPLPKTTSGTEAETPPSPVSAVQQTLFEDKLLSKPARGEHRIIGQLFGTYWLLEYHDNLYIIDQHAAHEKVLYERTMHSLKSRDYTSQQISPPIILTLSPQEQVMLENNQKELESIGFEIAPFGDNEYAVSAVPDNLFSIAKKELLLEMIGGLGQNLVLERVASLSCKAAVKGNHRLSEQEAEALIDELMELENPYACPHGRPTILSMSKYELEKKFKRII
ncbi:MAG: DNA mismatch repair endonuclease MutL [bacterium]|nr:DNA mismatch repair endonuclease MutL [bacterium]